MLPMLSSSATLWGSLLGVGAVVALLVAMVAIFAARRRLSRSSATAAFGPAVETKTSGNTPTVAALPTLQSADPAAPPTSVSALSAQTVAQTAPLSNPLSSAHNHQADLDVSVPNVYRVSRSFAPSNSDELEVCESDIVVVLERYSDGWILVDNEGVEGVIPFMLCEPVFGRVVADFEATGVDEITLPAGARVLIFEYFDDGWALVRRIDESGEGPTGMVPQDLLDDGAGAASVHSDSDSEGELEPVPLSEFGLRAFGLAQNPLCNVQQLQQLPVHPQLQVRHRPMHAEEAF